MDGSITRILKDLAAGVPLAEERLFDRVYDELRAMARAQVAGERRAEVADGASGDLAHEAYARLAGDEFENRRHLFFAYARAMQQVLVDRARRRRAARRGGGERPVPLSPSLIAAVPDASTWTMDAVEISELLDKLAEAAPREAEVFTLRFFGGLSEVAIAEVLGVSVRTVGADWSRARARLAAWYGSGAGLAPSDRAE